MVLVWSFSILLALTSLTFYNQYREYRKAEERMAAIYNEANAATDDLNRLFSLFAQSENAFRLYSVDFNAETFRRYTESLDSVKQYIDSLALLPIQDNPLANTPADMANRNLLASEYALLKKTVEQLVTHTNDSLEMVTYILPARLTATEIPATQAPEPSVDEETVTVVQDTIVRKRRSLFRRIFDARDDTIVVDVHTTRVTTANPPSTATAQSTTLVSAQQADLDALRRSFASLQEKERALVNANHALLNSVRNGIEKIRLMKLDADRLAEKQDFDRYRANTNVHNKQLVFLLCLMLAMVAVLGYYIRQVTVNEIKLENERTHVEKLAEEKSAILAGISHEIRTPLSSLLGTVDLMRKDDTLYEGDRGEARKNLLDSSYHSLSAINHTVTDILNLSRLESGTTDVAMAYFAPAETFHTVLSLQKRQAAAKGLELRDEISIDPQLAILGNEFRVKQIATNLLGNAIKYTREGHVAFKASVVAGAEQGTLRIEVKDTGIGIPPQHLDNVFRKYYTVDQSKSTSAFGLGLYITKLLTEELGGTITVASELGQGSVFVVEVPFVEHTEERPATVYQGRVPSLLDLPEDIRYLIVDDNPVNILFMKQFLAGQRHIEITGSSRQALALLDEKPFDVVITDIYMPEMDGWQLLNAIKSSGKYAHLKVLALSADTLEAESKNAQQAIAFDGVIPKPFSEADFARVVLQTLDSPGDSNLS